MGIVILWYRDEIPRGISLEQAQFIGLQRAHNEIRGEMKGIHDHAFMQMMQRNNLQPHQMQARRV